MQGVARLLKSLGHEVAGSDMHDFPERRELAAAGITTYVGHDAAHITSVIDEVVYSGAIPVTNPEMVAAQALGIPMRRRLEPVGEVMREKIGVAVSGTHGKTTTTTMITTILQASGRHPTALIGAEVKSLHGNVALGRGPVMVVEACEYQRAFLDLNPKMVVITNVEADHLDYFKDLEDIKTAFVDLINKLPEDGVVIANGDDEVVREVVGRTNHKVIWAGLEENNDVVARNLEFIEGRLYFTVNNERLHLQIPGRHIVADAVLAWAAAHALGVDDATIKHVLQDGFKNLARRFEFLGTSQGVTVVDDYGHHPTEIQATLEGARAYFRGRRLIVVFHPHQHSRTRILLHDFATSFSNADLVIIAPIYAVRDTAEDIASINSEKLVSEINLASGNAKFVGDFTAIEEYLAGSLMPGDVVMTMGAGIADVFGKELVDKLRNRQVIPTQRELGIEHGQS